MNLLENDGCNCLWRGHPVQPTDHLRPFLWSFAEPQSTLFWYETLLKHSAVGPRRILNCGGQQSAGPVAMRPQPPFSFRPKQPGPLLCYLLAHINCSLRDIPCIPQLYRSKSQILSRGSYGRPAIPTNFLTIPLLSVTAACSWNTPCTPCDHFPSSSLFDICMPCVHRVVL